MKIVLYIILLLLFLIIPRGSPEFITSFPFGDLVLTFWYEDVNYEKNYIFVYDIDFNGTPDKAYLYKIHKKIIVFERELDLGETLKIYENILDYYSINRM